MKIVMIAYNNAVDGDMMDVLQQIGISGYTKWTDVMGSGRGGGPHLMSHVWYKGNNVIMTCVEDNQAQALMERVREMRRTLGSAGIKAFSMPVDDVT